jgi:CubicO group peptidase (beta-lactamase class C family)
VFEPGSQFAYSNPAFNGLALIVEHLSGMKWQDFVRTRIFQPSGMMTSTITDGPHPEAGVAHGYYKDDDHWAEADYGEVPTFAAAGNGGVWSSVEELAAYERALQHHVFLKPETIADSRTIKTFPSWTSHRAPFIGWSWFILPLPDAVPDHLQQIGHTGSQGGFSANYVTVPAKDVMFVFLLNAPRDFEAITGKILDELSKSNWLD